MDLGINFDFRHLSVLILDEADKMLELGYGKQLTYLLARFPKQRRTGLFSATINSQIENMIKIGMQNPIFIDIKINLDSNNYSNYNNSSNENDNSIDIQVKEDKAVEAKIAAVVVLSKEEKKQKKKEKKEGEKEE